MHYQVFLLFYYRHQQKEIRDLIYYIYLPIFFLPCYINLVLVLLCRLFYINHLNYFCIYHLIQFLVNLKLIGYKALVIYCRFYQRLLLVLYYHLKLFYNHLIIFCHFYRIFLLLVFLQKFFYIYRLIFFYFYHIIQQRGVPVLIFWNYFLIYFLFYRKVLAFPFFLQNHCFYFFLLYQKDQIFFLIFLGLIYFLNNLLFYSYYQKDF